MPRRQAASQQRPSSAPAASAATPQPVIRALRVARVRAGWFEKIAFRLACAASNCRQRGPPGNAASPAIGGWNLLGARSVSRAWPPLAAEHACIRRSATPAMEAALTWFFGHVNHRVPTGRSPSFTHPLLPPAAPSKNRPAVPKGTLACPLPGAAERLSARPPAAVGWRADAWAQHSAHYVVNARGQRLFVQMWRPHPPPVSPPPSWWRRLVGLPRRAVKRPARPKGVVHIVHGLNDHSNKYARVARTWVEAGYVVIAHDFHGHGRSDGFRAYTSSMQHYVDDARRTIEDADRRLPSQFARLPKFLLAHSLGGAVAIHLARDSAPGAFRGVMLTAPAVKVYPKPLLKLFAPVLATLAPLLPVQRLKFDRRRRRRGSARAADEDDYCPHEDPLVVRSPVRARVGYEVLKSCDKIMSEADRFRVPVFVAHSREDRVTNARGTIDFHDKIASDDKTVQLYDGRVHDLLAEKRDMVMADMVSWASRRLR